MAKGQPYGCYRSKDNHASKHPYSTLFFERLFDICVLNLSGGDSRSATTFDSIFCEEIQVIRDFFLDDIKTTDQLAADP